MHKNKINTQFGELSRREFIQTSANRCGVAAVAGSITLPFAAQAKTPAIMPDEVSEKSAIAHA